MNERDRFDKFTERARRALHHAQEHAQRYNHNYIGTEHLLLGLLDVKDSVAVQVLEDMGIEPHKINSAVDFIIGRGDRVVLGEIGLTPRAKKVIELAVDEARRMNVHYIGTEHILLGLSREGEGIAAGVLESVGATLALLLRHTYSILGLEMPPELHSSKESLRPDVWRGSYSTTKIPPSQSYTFSSPPSDVIAHTQRNRFDKFTERARRVLSFAQEEAQRFQHNYIGTEHLLLGLMRDKDGIAAHVLTGLGIDLQKARESVEFIIGRGDRIVLGEIGLTPRTKQVIEFAVDEAQKLNHPYIGTEHLLLGLVREGHGIAVGVLESLGVKLEQVRAETLKILKESDDLRKQQPPEEPES